MVDGGWVQKRFSDSAENFIRSCSRQKNVRFSNLVISLFYWTIIIFKLPFGGYFILYFLTNFQRPYPSKILKFGLGKGQGQGKKNPVSLFK